MARHATELFAHFVYSQELSYDDLLAREDELKSQVEALLQESGGEFIHFEAMGDALHAQCVFQEYGEELFHGICATIAPRMDGHVEARLLFVSKDLECLHLYAASDKKWHEAVLQLPMAGPLGEVLRKERA